MNPERTLVILIPGFPSDANDSTCLPAQQRFIRGINRYQPHLRITILSFQYPFAEKEYTWDGNRVIAFGGRNRGGLSRRLLWNRVLKKLDRLDRECIITGILAFWAGECAMIGKRWAEKNQREFYCWIMGQDVLPGNKFIKRACLQNNDLVAIADGSAARMETNHHLRTVRIVPIGIDETCLPRPNPEKNIAILCAGSLIPLKQYHLAIEVMKQVNELFPEAQMVIAGNGPEKEKLEALADRYGLCDNIKFAGEQNYPGTLALMGRCRIFLHPSSFEGFSMACLEALGSGAEVISFEQPMQEAIPKWHIVENADQMAAKTLSLLTRFPDIVPVFPYPLKKTVHDILELFGEKIVEDIPELQSDCVTG